MPRENWTHPRRRATISKRRNAHHDEHKAIKRASRTLGRHIDKVQQDFDQIYTDVMFLLQEAPGSRYRSAKCRLLSCNDIIETGGYRINVNYLNGEEKESPPAMTSVLIMFL